MKQTILLTGLTGFIGRNVAREIMSEYHVTALVRPNTGPLRYAEFENTLQVVFLDLADLAALKEYLQEHKFDFIVHIGALRGGRNFSPAEYFRVNTEATAILLENAIKNTSKFIFCSSVGVLGAIPPSLPGTVESPYTPDNCYHSTKIESEKMLLTMMRDHGLQACIVRPSITYGEEDAGFPMTLTKLVQKRLLLLPKQEIHIQLTNISTLVSVFSQLLKNKFESGKIWIVADRDKVSLRELVDFIYRSHGNKRLHYPKYLVLPGWVFKLLIWGARKIKSELWTARLQLISQSWYYDVKDTYHHFDLEESNTIPCFEKVFLPPCGDNLQ